MWPTAGFISGGPTYLCAPTSNLAGPTASQSAEMLLFSSGANTLLHVAEDRRQIVWFLQWPVRIVRIGRHHRDRRVDPRQKLSLQVVVGTLQRGHFRYVPLPQLRARLRVVIPMLLHT